MSISFLRSFMPAVSITGAPEMFYRQEPGVTPCAIPDGFVDLSEYGWCDKKGDVFYFHDGTTRTFPAGESLHPVRDLTPCKDFVRWSEWTDDDRKRVISERAEKERKRQAEWQAQQLKALRAEEKREKLVAQAKRKLTRAEFQAVLTEGARNSEYND